MDKRELIDFIMDNLKIVMYKDSNRVNGELKGRLKVGVLMYDDGELIEIDNDYIYLEDLGLDD